MYIIFMKELFNVGEDACKHLTFLKININVNQGIKTTIWLLSKY